MTDHELAARLATETGKRLLALRSELTETDAAQRRDAGDRVAQAYLAKALAEFRPRDAILSEEALDDPIRLTADRVWIIDPLDGTYEFAEPDRTDWAVHVALWQRGELAAAAVALPAENVTFGTEPPARRPSRTPGPPRIVVSRSRAPSIASTVAARLSGTLSRLGSAGAKAMAVVQGQADIYLHAGGMHEWDSAAPVAVARAAGLHTSRLDGRQLAYNQPDPYQPDLLICAPEYASAVLAITGVSANRYR